MDQLEKHIRGLAKEAEKQLKNITLPEGVDPEIAAKVEAAKKAFDLSGNLQEKQQTLNSLLYAFNNHR